METGVGGRTVLVTGGSGGIGIEICRSFAREGANVAVAYHRNKRRADELSQELQTTYGVRAVSVQLDLTDPRTAGPAFSAIRAGGLAPVGVFVNNGMVSMDELVPLVDLTPESIHTALAGLTGTLVTLQLAHADMREGGWGRVVFVSSALARVGLPGRSAYVTVKGAMDSLAKNASRELAADGILVNTVSPAFVLTDSMAATELDGEATGARLRDAQRRVGPLGRPASPADVAAVVCFLGSEANTFVNGQIVVVDGGQR